MVDSKADLWIRRMTLGAMVALAMTLLVVGVTLYAVPLH